MYALSMSAMEPNLHLFHIKILLGSKFKSVDFESEKSCYSPRIILLNNVMTPKHSAAEVAAAAAAARAFNLEPEYQFKCTVHKGDIHLNPRSGTTHPSVPIYCCRA